MVKLPDSNRWQTLVDRMTVPRQPRCSWSDDLGTECTLARGWYVPEMMQLMEKTPLLLSHPRRACIGIQRQTPLIMDRALARAYLTLSERRMSEGENER